MGLLDDRRWEKCLFDGNWRPAASSAPQLEPATGAVLAEIGQASVEDVARAAATAEAAQVAWANSEPKTRAAVLHRAAELMKDHYDELAMWVVRETGAVPAKAETELLGFSVPDLEEAAGLATLVSTEALAAPDGLRSTARRVPRGVIGVISPFNFPGHPGAAVRSAGAGARQRRGSQARPPDPGDWWHPLRAALRGGRAPSRRATGPDGWTRGR